MRDFVVKYSGANASEIARDASNLMIRAMQRAAEAMHASLPSVELDVQNDIPLGVGLG